MTKVIPFEKVLRSYIINAEDSNKYFDHALMVYDKILQEKIDDEILRMEPTNPARKPEP